LELETAVFLPAERFRAYWRAMALGGSTSLAVSWMAGFLILSASGHARAGSYGQLDAFVVREKIRKDLPKINRCYESALRYEPELAGKVSVRFAVLRKGHVQGLEVVENTTGNPNVERCVARIVSAIRFPSRRSGKSVRFTFPFVFAPQDAP
jgi:TonB family protein